MGKHIKLYIDTVSPFGYMGYWMIRNSPVFKDVEVDYVPILLGGLMKTCGNTAPLFIKNKDKWINLERTRWAKQFKIPMREHAPEGFPIPTVNVQRLLTALFLKDPSKLPVAFDTITTAFWAPQSLPASTPKPTSGKDYNINSTQDLSLLLSPDSVLGKKLTDELIEAIGSAETKAALTKNTEAAFADGAFGLPWFHCTNDKGEVMGFWGFDHLGQVVKFLELEGLDRVGGSKTMKPLL